MPAFLSPRPSRPSPHQSLCVRVAWEWNFPPVAALQTSLPTTVRAEEATSFDERWAAWRAKGAAHDRAVRRKLAIAAPILIMSPPLFSTR